MQQVLFKDLGQMDYKTAWDYQEQLLHKIVQAKIVNRQAQTINEKSTLAKPLIDECALEKIPFQPQQTLLFVEHPPVYTLGKSGKIENVLISEKKRMQKGIEFYESNRGGDITFHGFEQLVGYPILDLEKFYTDIGRYLRNLEEVIILTMAVYGLKGERSAGETGVWLEPGVAGKERKICAIGVRCSRWVTMHGFAFNVNTDLSYFDYIVPCGIQNKQVTSMEKELNEKLSFSEVKKEVKKNFEKVFEVTLL